MSDWTFLRRVLIVAAVATLAFLAWRLSESLLLLFGAALIGLLFSSAADFVSRYTHLPRSAALALVVLVLVGAVLLLLAQFGAQLGSQLTDLWQRLPAAI